MIWLIIPLVVLAGLIALIWRRGRPAATNSTEYDLAVTMSDEDAEDC